jgi:uncharacterized protein (TIGR03083 family)
MIDLRSTRAAEIAPTERARARALLRAEVETWTRLLATLHPDEWDAPTVCDRWRVRDIVGHLIGHAEEIARPWRYPIRDFRGRRTYPELAALDAHMEVQVDDHRALDTDELQRAYSNDWTRALRALKRMPGFMRERSVSTGMEQLPKLKLGELADIIYLRDNWMHRDDVCDATSRPTAPQPHDEEVVAQVLRDLDRQFWKGPGVVIELSGCVNVAWRIGPDPVVATVHADALHFMRLLAGRARTVEIACTEGDATVPGALAEARVPF